MIDKCAFCVVDMCVLCVEGVRENAIYMHSCDLERPLVLEGDRVKPNPLPVAVL